MFKKFFAVGALLLLLAGCATLMQDREEKYGKAIPVITQSFAAPEIRPGVTWKVYLKASDPDGDMKNLYAEVFQYGLGPYPLSFTRIKESDGRDLSGYFYLYTGNELAMHFKHIILTVHVQDKAGHFSAPVKFSLAFNGAAPFVQPSPPAGVFQEKDLGPIMVDVRASNDGANGGPGFE